jgi:hypothetical protein
MVRRKSEIYRGIRFLVVVSCLIMVLILGQTAYAKENVVWEKNMDISLNRLTDITYAKGMYFVLDRDGGIRTSKDAVNWTRKQVANAELYSIACNENIFVVGGFNGTILTSTNGSEWKSVELGEIEKKYSITDIIWDGKQFIAIGAQNSYGIIMTSPDGITWTTRISETVEGFNSIIYNGNIYVVVGLRAIYTSDDAIVWTKVQNVLDKPINDIAWNGEKFIAVSFNGNILTSVNGTQWTVESIKDATFYRVIWDGKQFVTSCSNGVIFTSTDGVSWTRNTVDKKINYFHFIYHEGQYIALDGEKILSSEDLLNWTINNTFGIRGNLYSMAYNGKIFVVGGDYGTILTSTDGESWSSREPLTEESIGKVSWDGKRFVAKTTKKVFVSTDGENWIEENSSPLVRFSIIANNEKLSVAIDGSNSVYRSADGLEWEHVDKIIKDEEVRFKDLFWDGSRFILVGNIGNEDNYYFGDLNATKGIIATSLDGIEWTYKIFDDVTGFESAVYKGKKYIASGGNIYELTDLDSLTIVKSIEQFPFSSVLWDEDNLFAISNGSGKESLFTSEDGKTWTPIAVSYGSHLYKLEFYRDRYFALGANGTMIIGKIEASEYLEGDINNDKKVNSIDFALLRKYLLGKTYDVNLNNSDINRDGEVNSFDFALLRKILLE